MLHGLDMADGLPNDLPVNDEDQREWVDEATFSRQAALAGVKSKNLVAGKSLGQQTHIWLTLENDIHLSHVQGVCITSRQACGWPLSGLPRQW